LGKLDLTECSQLKVLTPEIGQLKELNTLILYGCSQLVVLPPEIGQLQALTRLTLGNCSRLQRLPAELGFLHALDTLDLNEACAQLTLAPEAKMSQPARTNVAAYARLLIVMPLEATPGELQAFLLEKPLAVPSFFKYILTDVHHAEWIGNAVKATPELACLTGPHGRRAIDAAVPECQKRMREALFERNPDQLHELLLANRAVAFLFFRDILTNPDYADWLGEAVKATPLLAGLTDDLDRRAINVAHATCQQRMLESSWLCKRYELQPGPPEHRSATSVVIRAEDHADKPDYAQIFTDADKDGSGTLELNELDVVAKKVGLSKDLVVSEANKQDGTTSMQLGKDAFVSACKQLLGNGPRKVVIKLMKDKVQWQREMESRRWKLDSATNRYVPSQNEVSLDAQYVVQALDAPTQAEMATAVSYSLLLQQLAEKYMEKASIKEYAYPVVMDAANRNLAQIYLQERPGPEVLRDLARQIFEAVQHLHSRKLMHGDLKVRAPPMLLQSLCASTCHTCVPSFLHNQLLCDHTLYHADAQPSALHHGRQAAAHRL
jgi:hypothetical protein